MKGQHYDVFNYKHFIPYKLIVLCVDQAEKRLI